ncbi:C-type lectin domain family 2 member D-like isoform X2 [Phyllobates terribilis]|uniref:C-type lectin domain family 2 member D-like isoform X2 n=1 Tax=Phyllobates terribilis TaxID=111132 RepID=UPI003CCB5038
MGVCEEDGVLEHENMMRKEQYERLLIVVLILVIIGLTAALIVVRTQIAETKNEKSAPCEDDWIWYRGKCYYFSTERNTWNNSEKFCNSHNSSLAIIDNKDLDFVFRCKGLDNHWIGIRRTDDNKAWTWTNGSLYDESLFKIRRSSQENIEYVYLNSRDMRSDRGIFDFKWICSKT